MSQPPSTKSIDEAAGAPASKRLQTPRLPSNFLYRKLVPIAIGLMVVILFVILAVVILGPLFGY
jgi:hypothetical protein